MVLVADSWSVFSPGEDALKWRSGCLGRLGQLEQV